LHLTNLLVGLYFGQVKALAKVKFLFLNVLKFGI
jgi:hypothetical protein